MPDIYLDRDLFNQGAADIWDQSATKQVNQWKADAWMSGADTVVSQAHQAATAAVADRQDRIDAANRAAGDAWHANADGVIQSTLQTLQPAQPAQPSLTPPTPAAPDLTGAQPSASTAAAPVAADQQAASVPNAPVTAPMSTAGGYQAVARDAAQKAGIDPDVFVRQIQQESGFDPAAKSPAGATGIAQFMPATAQGLGIDPTDPVASLYGAANHMAQLVKQNGGDVAKALAAYNAGQGNVDKYGGIPPFEETQRYVKTILGGAQQAAQNVGQAVQQSASAIVDQVKPFLGQAYSWGGKSPQTGFDCSGLAGYLTTGQPESTTTLYGKSSTITQDQAKPGDLVFWNMGSNDPHLQHVAVYLGDGKIVQSGGDQAAVNIGSIDQRIGSPPEFRRVGDGGAPAQASVAPPGAPSPADPPTTDPSPSPTQTASPFDPLKHIGDTISGAITSGLQNIWQNIANSPSSQAVRDMRSADANLTPAQAQQQLTEMIPKNPLEMLGGAGLGAPTGGEALTQQRNEAIAQANPLKDVPVLGGAATFGAQAFLDPTNLLLAGEPSVARAAGETASAAGTAARDIVTSPELQSVLRAKQPAQVYLGLPGGGTPAATLAQSADPLIARTGQMLQARPPTTPNESLVDRAVRAFTNRWEAADRFQEDALRSANLDTANPPTNLDLSATLRLAADPAAEVRVQQSLQPAIRAVGEQDLPYLSAYLMHNNNVDVAAALANPRRTFPGGFSYNDSLNMVQNSLPNELGPQRFAKVQQAADQVYQFTDELRQRMVDAGLISQQTAQDWAQKYPHWVPTRVLDYMDEAGGPKVGSKISLSDNGVRQYTEDGTARFAEDPLASLIGLARQVESKARKNEAANALVELDQLAPAGSRMLTPTNRPVTVGETVIQRINNGTVERYVAPPALANVINGPQITQAPGWVRAWTGFVRSMATVLSPAFALVRNPSLDIPEYMTREISRAGGNPLQIPHIMAELARGYADAFRGFSPLTEGTFAGQGTQQYLLGGGGGAGLATRTFADRADAVARLAQSGQVLGSTEDVGRVIKDLVTLKPVARTAERTELGPRIASMRLAEQRGATPVRAVLNGRNVTIDFNEGGTVAKTINQFIPFFNAGIQGSVNVTRMFHENPTGATIAALQMAGLPSVLAEAWNNSDPQRARDYADVPDYLKQQGVVVMLPGEAPTDDRGNRRPQFYWINMRGLAPFSTLAREGAARVLQAGGNTNVRPEDWQALTGDILMSAAPIRANTVGDVPGALTGSGQSLIPGADIGLQLALNKDIFRNADIATPRRDQYASAVGKSIAGALTTLARTQNPATQIHPSQVDFAVQQALGGVGSTILGAGNIVAGQRSDNAPQSAPVIGGLARAIGVRGDTGATLQEARSQVLTPDAQRVINDAGLQAPAPVLGTVHYEGLAIPLHQDEQARYQQRYTEVASNLITRYRATLTGSYDQVQRQEIMRQITGAAQTQAEQEVLRTIPAADLNQRIRAENVRRRAGVP